jgi:hypothetical protein
VGLPLSVGKVYVHASYANINSTSFEMNLSRPDSLPVQINYLNVGLLFGQSKVLGGDDVADDKAYLPHILPRLLAGSLDEVATMHDFLSLHADELRVQTKGRNLFIHPSLGGFGVPVPVGWKFDVTTSQIAEAQRILDSLPKYESAQAPHFSRVVLREEPIHIHSPWRDIAVSSELTRLRRVVDVNRNLTKAQLDQLLVGVVEVAPSRTEFYDDPPSERINWSLVDGRFQGVGCHRSGEMAFVGVRKPVLDWACDFDECD